MTATRHVLLLIGSPKGLNAGNSSRLGKAVVEPLEALGWRTESLHLHAAIGSQETLDQLMEAIDSADLIVLSMPLYVDSLPAPVIEALYRVAQHRDGMTSRSKPRFISLVNCGFVDPWQNAGAQRMVQQFCKRANLEWAGSLSLGMGGNTNTSIREAISLIVESAQREQPVPPRVTELTRKRVMPPLLYVLGGNHIWRREARKNGLRRRDLKAQPYKRAT